MNTFQKQAVIKSIEKKTKINDLLKVEDLFLFSMLTQNWFKKF